MDGEKIIREIERVMDMEISPIIESHGGFVKIKELDNGVVTVTLGGNCSSCPSAQITTEEIIREKLMEKFPEYVKDVKLYSKISNDIWNFAKKMLSKEE